MVRRILLITTLIGLLATAQHTGRGKLKTVIPIVAQAVTQGESYAINADTIVGDSTARYVRCSGFEKTLRSRHESFFVTNCQSDTITAMALTITYLDTSGRMLHRVSRHVDCNIPGGETRQLTIPTWDSQQTFYYRLSTVPKLTTRATPFDVKINVDSLCITNLKESK
jgi:hypothetical protein